MRIFDFFLPSKGPPSSFLMFCSKRKSQKAQRVSPLEYFDSETVSKLSFLVVFDFFVSKGPPSFFLIFYSKLDFQKALLQFQKLSAF